MELLSVIAIILLLAALLFPAFGVAQRSALRGQALVHGRQIYIALAAYREDHGFWPHDRIGVVADAGYLGRNGLLHVPRDVFPNGYGEAVRRALWPRRIPESTPVSWDYFTTAYSRLGTMDRWWAELESQGRPAGLAVLRIHGEVFDPDGAPGGPTPPTFFYTAPFVQIRGDGSVAIVGSLPKGAGLPDLFTTR